MIPDTVKVTHSINPSRPYPCGYCYNCRSEIINPEGLKGRAKVVASEFKDSSESTKYFKDNRCNAGLRRPTSLGDCEKFAQVKDRIRIQPQYDILSKFQSEYMTYVLTTVWANEGISRRELIDRRHSGYQSRSRRINELIEMNLIDEDSERLYVTFEGERIAEAISVLEQTTIAVLQEEDVLSDDMALRIMQYLDDNPDSSYEQFCSHFGITRETVNDTGHIVNKEGDYDVIVYDNLNPTSKGYDVIFSELLYKGYIEAEFDPYDWNTTRYSMSARGRRQWLKHL